MDKTKIQNLVIFLVNSDCKHQNWNFAVVVLDNKQRNKSTEGVTLLYWLLFDTQNKRVTSAMLTIAVKIKILLLDESILTSNTVPPLTSLNFTFFKKCTTTCIKMTECFSMILQKEEKTGNKKKKEYFAFTIWLSKT